MEPKKPSLPTTLPTLEDLKKVHPEKAELMLEVQQKSQKAFSKSLSYMKDKRYFQNNYSLRPDALETAFQRYSDMIMQKGEGRNPYVYGELKDSLRKNIAGWIGSKRPEDITLGYNATTFLGQLLTNFWGKPLRILTSDQEFYGTVRILARLKEIPGNTVTEVPIEPWKDFHERVLKEANSGEYDLAIFSHVFFKSANVLDDLDVLVKELKQKIPRVLVDGSAAFGNLPVDKQLGHVMDEIYYIGGIYKFVGSGEGFAFMSLPKGCDDRPVLTGWLFGDYTDESQYYTKPLYYSNDGDRYANSTSELSIWVRTNDIIEYFDKEGFTVDMKNQYTQILQDYMIKRLDEAKVSFLGSKNLVSHFGKWRPLQTAFDLKDEKLTAAALVKELEKYGIVPDFRGSRIRLCPAIYHTIFDIDYLVDVLKEIDRNLVGDKQ